MGQEESDRREQRELRDHQNIQYRVQRSHPCGQSRGRHLPRTASQRNRFGQRLGLQRYQQSVRPVLPLVSVLIGCPFRWGLQSRFREHRRSIRGCRVSLVRRSGQGRKDSRGQEIPRRQSIDRSRHQALGHHCAFPCSSFILRLMDGSGAKPI